MNPKLYNTRGYRIFTVVNIVLLFLIALICILPLLNIAAISFSDKSAAAANKVGFWPVGFNVSAYKMVFSKPTFLIALWNSVKRTVLGVTINLVLMLLTAYPLSKSAKSFKGRNIFMWIFVFCMIFNGGMVPGYILINNLHMMDTIWALVLPPALPIMSMVIVMNYMRGLPEEIEEAAYIDGASYWRTFTSIIVPLSTPVIATVTLFSFVGHWNSWFDGLIFMNDVKNYPLQTYLQMIIVNRDATSMEQAKYFLDVSEATLKAAQVCIAILPIILIYPLVQRYFVSGIVMGSVKG